MSNLDTNVLTHLIITYDGQEIPCPESVKDAFDDDYCPEAKKFIIGDVTIRKNAIKMIKKSSIGNSGRKSQYEKIEWEKEFDRQMKAFEKWKKEHLQEWEDLLAVTETIILEEESKRIIQRSAKALRPIIEAEARIACGFGIDTKEN